MHISDRSTINVFCFTSSISKIVEVYTYQLGRFIIIIKKNSNRCNNDPEKILSRAKIYNTRKIGYDIKWTIQISVMKIRAYFLMSIKIQIFIDVRRN